MALYKVVFEIQVSAESPLEAAKTVQDWIKEPGDSWAFIVQRDDENQNPIYSVDLNEYDEDAVLEIKDHRPLIS